MKSKVEIIVLVSLCAALVIPGCRISQPEQESVLEVSRTTGGNPAIKEGSADPSVRVFNDRVYVYSSHDFSPENEFWIMKDWKVFSTDDLLNFTDHGVALKGEDVSWAPEPDHCWAPDCIEKDGKYYFYFPLSDIRGVWKGRIGVGVSDKPYGPFIDPLGHPLVDSDTKLQDSESGIYNIDPAAFTDDDGRSYLFWGNGACLLVELNDDMISFKSEIRDVIIEDHIGYREGPFVWKRNGIYYLLYSRVGGSSYDVLDYATSDHIAGPYHFRGTVIAHGMKGNEHGSVFQYRGQWYVAYHDLFPTDKYRKTCLDIIHYRDNGEIVRSFPSRKGVGWYDAIELIEAENYFEKSGDLEYAEHKETGFYISQVENGSWLHFPNVKMPFDFGGNFFARVASGGDGGTIEIVVDSLDGTIIGDVNVVSTDGWDNWKTVNTVLDQVSPTMDIYLKFKGGEGALFSLDWIDFN